MANKNTNMFIGLLVAGLIIFFFLGNSVGIFSSVGGSVTRDVETTKVRVGDTFSVIYRASGTGAYGVSIVDTISGGCTFSDGETVYKAVILSDDTQVSVKINAPDTATTCRMQGDYKFGIQNVVGMSDKVIMVVGEDEIECEVDSDCEEGEVCEDNLCIEEEDEDVLADTALNNLAKSILGLDDDLDVKTAKLYIMLFYAGVLLFFFFLIKLIFSTPK